eukprot:Phypoly_transcript_08322.p1 GENE.Phypoly_transcript_08322~~Phypoly_transcript_08322.p1  ORF type:complete len:480 (+),score=70.01 Phypoly_transcript_08322:88-1440(+)
MADAVYIAVLSVAGFFTILATIWTSVLIHRHIRNYTKPSHQKYIIRILLMPIIYAVDSWLSLYFKHDSWAIFIDIGRDCYEAYVIYSFFKLLVEYLGGIEAVCTLVGKKPSFDFLPFYLAHDGHKFYHRCLQGIMQYVITRPTLAVVAAILQLFHKYGDGIYSWDKGYIYIQILNNISVTIALYCLGMFYQRFEMELKPHSPVLKFMVIKGVIFFTFWQSVGIVILGWVGVIPNTAHHTKTTISFFLNDTLICFEMFIAAVAHHYAFPYQQYQSASSLRDRKMIASVLGNETSSSKKEHVSDGPSALVVLGHVSNQGDVVRDAMASVVGGDDASFVEYRKFENIDEQKKAKQFSIVKKSSLGIKMKSPLMYNKGGEEDNNQIGIEIDSPTYGEAKDDFGDARARTASHTRAAEFSKKEIAEEPHHKFGDAILTKPEDTEVIDARYEINLL